MIRRVGAWLRRQWGIATDPHGAAESDAMLASLKASAAKAGLRPGVEHLRPARSTVAEIVTVVEVTGAVLVVVSGALSLAGLDPRGWFA